MSNKPPILTRLKNQNGTLISYYARPKSFNTGGVNLTNADWMKAFSDYGVPNLISAYMKNGLFPLGDTSSKFPVKHFLNHRVFSIPIEFSFLKKENVLVYLHEGWTLSNFIVAIFCVINKIPYALMPHGVYESQIMKNLKLLKLRIILERFVISKAHFVHLFFEGERKLVTNICKSAKIAIAPTGRNANHDIFKSWNGDGDYFLYAGRIDPYMKGLDLLVTSWKISGRSEKLLLAGPEFNGGINILKKLVRRLRIEDKIIFLGNLSPDDLVVLMRHARGFLHISRWESYGRSPIDAISMGMPTLISDQMQIACVSQISNMAYITSLTPENIIYGINEIAQLTSQNHQDRFLTNYENFFNYLDWERVIDSLVDQI